QWQQVLTSSGFLSAALLEKDITFTAYVARVGGKNVVGVVVQKVEENLARAAFETQFRAAKGDEIFLGFKNGDPLTFITTKAGNAAQAGTFSGKLNMSANWEAEVSDADLAAHRDALTTRVIDAMRITAASGQIDRAIPEKNGQRLMQKFGCFFRSLDSAGVSVAGGQQSESDSAGGVVAMHRASSSSPLEAAVRSTANCRSNFTVSGSMVRGTSYETYDEYPASDYTAGLSTVEAAIARAGLVVESAEKTAGTLYAVGKNEKGKDIRYVFTVVPTSGGVRVTVARDLRLGTHGSDGAMRDEMCKVLSTIAETMAAAVPAKRPVPPAAKSPQAAPAAKIAPETPTAAPATGVEERLRQLEALFKKGLITEEEYKKKRAQILSSI
ncbi:MAG TPA: SHOCT domain-containing protein, partial [Thermoanaerobaculia bacterium]